MLFHNTENNIHLTRTLVTGTNRNTCIGNSFGNGFHQSFFIYAFCLGEGICGAGGGISAEGFDGVGGGGEKLLIVCATENTAPVGNEGLTPI